MFSFFRRHQTSGLEAQLRRRIISGVCQDLENAALEQSLFSYCCGKDPTPIAAFGSEHPLYVHADLVDCGQGDFRGETGELYGRLKNADLQSWPRKHWCLSDGPESSARN